MSGKIANSRYICGALAWIGTWICCTLAMMYFYSLSGTRTVDPFKSHFEQSVAVVRTAFAATLVVSWAIWLGVRRKSSFLVAVLKTGSAVEASLILYAIVGLRVAVADWRSPLDLVFPSTFFAEYNWLTFILEVAPVTAIGASLLSYFPFRPTKREVSPVEGP